MSLQSRYSLRWLLAALVLAVLGLAGWYTYRARLPDPYVQLCMYVPHDAFTSQHVLHVLDRAQIPYVKDGDAIVDWVNVPASRRAEAMQLLEESARTDHSIRLRRNVESYLVSGEESSSFKHIFDRPLEEVVQEEGELPKLLAAALRPEGSLLRDENLKIVNLIEGCRRQYLDAEGKWQTGYDFSVKLANGGTEGNTVRYKLADNLQTCLQEEEVSRWSVGK